MDAKLEVSLRKYKPSLAARARRLLAPVFSPQTLVANDYIVPDTAFWEGRVNFETMKAAGAKAVVIRAGQGSWEDTEFRASRTNLKAAGFPWATYWFYDTRYSPKSQANLYASILGDDKGEFIVVDWECPDSYGGNYRGWKNLYNFIVELQTVFPGMKIVIYTGDYYWYDHSPSPYTEAASLAWFGQFDLWIARYIADGSLVKLFAPWTDSAKIIAWQYTGSGDGLKYGCQSLEVDLNYWYKPFSGAITPPPPPPTGDSMYQGTVLAYSLNVRNAPQTGAIVNYLNMNDKVEADRVENGWWHLTKIRGVAQTGEAWAYEGATKNYIRTDAVIVPSTDVKVQLYVNGALAHEKSVPAGGAVKIEVTD